MWDFSSLNFVTDVGRRSTITVSVAVTSEGLAEKERRLPAAIALSWGATTVTIKCPYCEKTHKHWAHHFARDEVSGRRIQNARGRYTYDTPSSRYKWHLAPCIRKDDPTLQYSILYPFEDDPRVDGLSFEISCIEGRDRYCTVGLDIPQPCREGKGKQVESEEEREIRWGIEMLSLRDGDYTVRLFSGHPREPISQASKLIVSAATCGNVKELESLLSDSPDPQSLLKARFDGDGVPLLSLAVCNGHSEAVTYLINKGVDVNAADFKGRTALMEAALWSHPLIVDKLLIAGANRNMRDSSGMLAADFAEESEANDEERNRRHLKYSENPFFAKRNRKIIRGLLGHTFVRTKGKWLELKELDDAFFYKSPQARTISFVTPSTGLPIRYMSKTAAFLDRGSPFPVVSAVSGYLGPDNQEFLTATESFERLNPGHWMPETVRLAQAFGFDFARHDHDQPGIPGSYYACHAESMLMCFFVMRNYIFRDYKSGETVNDDFLQLFMLQPRNQRARIIVSHEPCLSCVKLKDCIRAKLDIEFELKVVRVRDP